MAEVVLRLAGYTALYEVYSKPSLFWDHDDRLGWTHQAGAEGKYVGPRPYPIEFEAPVRINSLGLRGPEVEPRAPDELRLLFLGDSVVAGFEVAYEDTFVAIVERKLARRLGRPVRAINAAVRGYGTDQSLLYYREHGRQLDADVVVLFHSENDPLDNITLHRTRRPFGKPAFALEPDGGLRLVGVPVPRFPLCSAWMLGADGEPVDVATTTARVACFLQTRLADHSALFAVVARTLARWPAATAFLKRLSQPPDQQEEIQAVREAGIFGAGRAAPALADKRALTTALILALARDVAADGADFQLMFTKPKDLAQVDVERIQAAHIEAKLMTADTPLRTHWRNDGHLNEAGHDLVARLTLKGLWPRIAARSADGS